MSTVPAQTPIVSVGEWTNEQLDLVIAGAYVPRIPGQVSLVREAFVALRVARTRIAELEAELDFSRDHANSPEKVSAALRTGLAALNAHPSAGKKP